VAARNRGVLTQVRVEVDDADGAVDLRDAAEERERDRVVAALPESAHGLHPTDAPLTRVSTRGWNCPSRAMDAPLNAVDTFLPKMSLFATSSWRSATLLSTYTIAARCQRSREEAKGGHARTSPQSTTDRWSVTFVFHGTLMRSIPMRREPWRMPFGPKRVLHSTSAPVHAHDGRCAPRAVARRSVERRACTAGR
jgi:hypothetical protein